MGGCKVKKGFKLLLCVVFSMLVFFPTTSPSVLANEKIEALGISGRFDDGPDFDVIDIYRLEGGEEHFEVAIKMHPYWFRDRLITPAKDPVYYEYMKKKDEWFCRTHYKTYSSWKALRNFKDAQKVFDCAYFYLE